MSFDYQEVAEILETDTWNESEDSSMRNFHSSIYPGPEVFSALLQAGYCVTSFERDNCVNDKYDYRMWVATHEEVADRWNVHISVNDEVEERVEREAEALVDEMKKCEKVKDNYHCVTCNHTFRVDDVTEYEGCPQCRSRNTEPV